MGSIASEFNEAFTNPQEPPERFKFDQVTDSLRVTRATQMLHPLLKFTIPSYVPIP